MKKIVVFTGAGVSAESGIATFRDSDGLWANYRIEDVCTPEALAHNRAQVLEFYNIRRRELLSCRPNAAHTAIKRLEERYDVQVITQNIDDLHERAGSGKVLHLHGELRCLRSGTQPERIYRIEGWEQAVQAVQGGGRPDDCAKVWRQDETARDAHGDLLRPHVVFFGESVPAFEQATDLVKQADILIIVGTSLAVYPAAALALYAPPAVPVYVVDPHTPDVSALRNPVTCLAEPASVGMPRLAEELLQG